MEEHITNDTNLNKADSELLDALFRAEYADMVDYARLIMYCKGWAEDAVQETFAMGTKKFSALYNCPNRVGWLYRTLQNIVMNKNREYAQLGKLVKKLSAVPDSVTPLVEPSFEPGILFVEGYKNLIREADFEILTAYYCDGYPYEELAKKYSVSISACKMRVLRAKNALKKALLENL